MKNFLPNETRPKIVEHSTNEWVNHMREADINYTTSLDEGNGDGRITKLHPGEGASDRLHCVTLNNGSSLEA